MRTNRVLRFALVAGIVTTSGVLVAAFVVSGQHPPKPLSSIQNPIRVTFAGGCPSSTRGFDGIRNRESSSGLGQRLAPQKPTRALVCRYAPLTDPPTSTTDGRLRLSTALAGAEASRLVDDLDRISAVALASHSCGAEMQTTRVLVVFGYVDRPDVDIWFERAGCTTVNNGYLIRERLTPKVISEFDTFTADLDRFAPAPR